MISYDGFPTSWDELKLMIKNPTAYSEGTVWNSKKKKKIPEYIFVHDIIFQWQKTIPEELAKYYAGIKPGEITRQGTGEKGQLLTSIKGQVTKAGGVYLPAQVDCAEIKICLC